MRPFTPVMSSPRACFYSKNVWLEVTAKATENCANPGQNFGSSRSLGHALMADIAFLNRKTLAIIASLRVGGGEKVLNRSILVFR